MTTPGNDAGHYWSLGHTAVLGLSLTEALGVFVEYIGTVSELPYEAFFSTGTTILLNENFPLDADLRIGLNEHTDALTTFTGFTLRF
jgi:hypothetical protein